MGGNLDVGMRCIKYMLFISNLLFWIIGFLIISIGTTISSIYGDFERFMASHHFSPSALMIAIGVITFFVAALGFWGAIRESPMLVNLYSMFLFMILILEISAAFAAYAMRSNIVENVYKNMVEALPEYGEIETAKKSWDFAQTKLQCCGVQNFSDWKQYQNFDGSRIEVVEGVFKIPRSCCVYGNCEGFFERGCLNRLSYIISECAFMLGSAAVCVALVQVLGIIFANILSRAIRREKTNMQLKREQCRQVIFDEYVASSYPGGGEKQQPVLYMPVPVASNA